MKIKVKKPTVRRKNVSHVVISIYKSDFEKKENQVLLVGVFEKALLLARINHRLFRLGECGSYTN